MNQQIADGYHFKKIVYTESKLRAAREKTGKTQAQVAKEAGISEQAYQLYEYGKCTPGVRTAIRIADALGVTDLRELFGAATPDSRKENDGNCERGRNVGNLHQG